MHSHPAHPKLRSNHTMVCGTLTVQSDFVFKYINHRNFRSRNTSVVFEQQQRPPMANPRPAAQRPSMLESKFGSDDLRTTVSAADTAPPADTSGEVVTLIEEIKPENEPQAFSPKSPTASSPSILPRRRTGKLHDSFYDRKPDHSLSVQVRDSPLVIAPCRPMLIYISDDERKQR